MELITCAPVRARITPHACRINQELSTAGVKPGDSRAEVIIDRKLWCNSTCPRWEVETRDQNMETDTDRYIRATEAARMLGVHVTTLYKQRMLRKGMPYVTKKGVAYYRMSDIQAEISEKQKAPAATGAKSETLKTNCVERNERKVTRK